VSDTHEPLTQAELERDMWLSWWLAHWMVGERVRQGGELPEMFRSNKEATE
jgi:hypothetical protein